jgi:hypothetical protein
MSAFRGKLSSIEARLQSLIEGGAARFFPAGYTPHDLAMRLEEAMRTQALADPQGGFIAPNLFILGVNEDHLKSLQAETTLLDELAQVMYAVGQEAGFHFIAAPVIRVAQAANLAEEEIEVSAQHSLEDLPDTAAVEVPRSDDLLSTPKNAYLIVDGTQVFPLLAPVVNIGRRSDNQLIVDDPRVSRLHAQLRLVKGQYVIFDLDSIGGTWVNGQRVRQCVLQPGDVVELSGVPLVFGQDLASPDETQELSPGSASAPHP